MRGRTLALSILLVAGGGVAACGDDDGGGGADAQPYIEALSEELQADDPPMEADDADCVAEGAVEALGADFLVENDVSPEELADADGPQELDVEVSEAQARGAAEAMFSCDIDVAAGALGPDASDEAIACVNENLDTDLMVDAITAEYLGNAEESQELMAEVFGPLQAACGEFLDG